MHWCAVLQTAQAVAAAAPASDAATDSWSKQEAVHILHKEDHTINATEHKLNPHSNTNASRSRSHTAEQTTCLIETQQAAMQSPQ